MSCCFATRATRAEGENVTLLSSKADRRKHLMSKLLKALKGHWGKREFLSSQSVLIMVDGKEVPAIVNTRHPVKSSTDTRYEVRIAEEVPLHAAGKGKYVMVKASDMKAVPSFREGERVFFKDRDAIIAESYMGIKYDVQVTDGELHCGVSPSTIQQNSGIPRREQNLEYAHGLVTLKIHQANDLPKSDQCGTTDGDPYCELYDRKGRLISSTNPIPSTSNPVWNHEEIVRIANTDLIFIVIKDTDLNCFGNCSARNEIIAKGFLSMEDGLSNLIQFGFFTGTIPLYDVTLGRVKRTGEIKLTLQFQNNLLVKNLNKWEITRTRFRSTTGNNSTLYQSAYVGDYWNKTLAPLTLYEGTPLARPYVRESCWEDLYQNLIDAKKMIYIYGWSVDPSMQLLRNLPPGTTERLGDDEALISSIEDGTIPLSESHSDEVKKIIRDRRNCTLGAIIKKKARDGVPVCIMIWDEVVAGYGAAGTGSAACREFFRDTSVQVRCMKRDVQSAVLSASLTHHQKGVICDAPAEGDMLRLVAFIGGIDLTGGRWDCPAKHLFSLHNHDVYQQYAAKGEGKPMRQPWSDIHSKVEGPLAYDAYLNFQNRWKTQGGKDGSVKIDSGALAKQVLNKESSGIYQNNDQESWNAQLFRSIDTTSDSSVVGIEADCQRAWVDAIERSTKFIYIENQYFIGSSEMWINEKTHGGASNIIPQVITKRIQQAIRNKEPYCVYVLIPLFPEGLPASAVVQELLRWQKNTIQGMYDAIGRTLKEANSPAHPRDYLQFFAAGNRESLSSSESDSLKKMVPSNSFMKKYDELRNMVTNRRAAIYIHSKMLLVDDEYIILGSANINDRSMSGNRDTEIAVGLCQPHFTGSDAHGAVKCFRLSLWCEHMKFYGSLPDVVRNPETIDCSRYVRERTEQAWNDYCSTSNELTCHLLAYPYVITKEGKLSLGQTKEFPDYPGSSILGKDSILPDHMTA